MTPPRTSIPIFLALALAGCATTDKIVLDDTKRPPSTHVDIYNNGKVPERPYTTIAQLSYLGPREEELTATKRFVSESKKLGGEGVIVTVKYAGVKGGGTAFQTTAWVFKGEVIAYQSAEATERNHRAEMDLIGHWESISMTGPTLSSDVVKLAFDFTSNNEIVGTTFLRNGQPYHEPGKYSVDGNRLIILSPGEHPEPSIYSLEGDHLTIRFGNNNVTLLRVNKAQ